MDNSNTMHTNKFGYDESSSNDIQSGDDNDNKVGTNNVSADGTHSSTGNRLTGTISLNSSAKRANHDAPHIDGLNSQSDSIANTNNVDMNDLTASNDQAPDEYNPSNDDSQGPGDAGGIPGENEEDDMDDDIDEFNHPNPSPMPDSLNRNNQDKNQDNETPHQENSIDQT